MYKKSDIELLAEDKRLDKLNSVIEKKNFLKNTLLKTEDYFFNNFLPEIKTYLDKESLVYVCFLIKKYNLALDELRRNNFSSADSYFCEIELASSFELTVPNLIVKTVANNVLAYKAYKLGDREKASDLLINSLEIDCILEEEGLGIMHFHKIQTLHNIARTYLKQNLSAGVNISIELMKYLSTKSGNFRLGKFIFLQEKNDLSPELSRKLFLQIFNDLVFHFVKHDDNNDLYFLEIYRRNLNTMKYKEDYLNLIEEWLDIVLDLNRDSGPQTIKKTTKFLNRYSDKLACLSIFLIKKLHFIYPSKITSVKKIKFNMKSYGISA
jgi:hypothetical protein